MAIPLGSLAHLALLGITCANKRQSKARCGFYDSEQALAEAGLAPRLGRGDMGSNPLCLTMEERQRWRIAADCKSVPFGVSGFESHLFHQRIA